MTMAISPINGLVFSSAALSRINAARFDNFLAQARTNLDPDEEVIFVYDGAPAHRNPVIPAKNLKCFLPTALSCGAGNKLSESGDQS